MATLDTNLTREEAFELLKTYNSDEFHLQHGCPRTWSSGARWGFCTTWTSSDGLRSTA